MLELKHVQLKVAIFSLNWKVKEDSMWFTRNSRKWASDWFFDFHFGLNTFLIKWWMQGWSNLSIACLSTSVLIWWSWQPQQTSQTCIKKPEDGWFGWLRAHTHFSSQFLADMRPSAYRVWHIVAFLSLSLLYSHLGSVVLEQLSSIPGNIYIF